MNSDLVVQLSESGVLMFKRRVVKLVEAPEVVNSGKFDSPPSGLWSVGSGYALGDADVGPLAAWLRGCFGAPILDRVRKTYPNEGLLRVLVTAEPELEPEMMTVPWEVLESPAQDWATTERISAVRILQAPEDVQTPTSSADPLKIGILWANPDQNIPGLEDHLRLLKAFLDGRPIEFAAAGPIEFTDHDAVRRELARVRPDVVYYIGHADPLSTDQVALRIGRAGGSSHENAGDFLRLLQEIGPPHLLFLNACSTALGWKLNPYLGVALACGRGIDAVLAMQTEVPVDAAMVFARQFFLKLASGAGLAASTKSGRNEIQRIYEPPSFTPFIPVLTQRTRLDKVLAVDTDGRELRRLLRELQSEIERIEPQLGRCYDPSLTALIQGDANGPRVALVAGPKGSGKSTSVRRAVLDQLSEQRFRSGDRYIYYDARFASFTSSDRNIQMRELLRFLAKRFLPLTESLAIALKANPPDPPDRPGALLALVSWFDEERTAGHTYHIVLDHLDPALAAGIAELGSRIVEAGYITLVAENPSIDPEWPVNRIEIDRMREDEVRAALERTGLPQADEAVQRLMDFSNGLPYFVAGYLRRGATPGASPGDLAQTFLDSRASALSAQELDILHLAAVCWEAVPGEIFAKNWPIGAVEPLADEDYLLMKTGDDAYRLPEVLRDHLVGLISSPRQIELHAIALNGFLDMAERGESTRGESKYRLVTRWFAEVLRHALALANLQNDLGSLDSALDIAEKLHDRYMSDGDFAAARLAWESYRDVAQALGRYDDRVSDVRYADCLMRTGDYENAELLLEQATSGADVDRIQLAGLFLWSNLAKDRGYRSEGGERVKRLRAALDVASKLEKAGEDPRWVRKQVASLKHTLGNALGFGKDAKPEEALGLLREAQKIFEDLNDPLQFRAINEQIEIKRYNGQLSPQEREESKKTLHENLRGLVARDMQFDAVQHLYELGRLEDEPARRASWFEQAFERAGKVYEPEHWNAGINWRQAQVEAQLATFTQVVPFLEEYAARLAPWHGRAWCRRKRREALLFLAEGYRAAGENVKALTAAAESWKVVEEIAEVGEGRKDRTERLRVAALAIGLAVEHGKLDRARAFAANLAKTEGKDPGPVSQMNTTELGEYVQTIVSEAT